MPKGNTVRPLKWSNIIDLYDDGTYSAIWGNFDNSPKRCLGVRWNGNSTNGYPVQGNNPLWFIEPDYLAKMILLEFCSRVNKNPKDGNIQNILVALNEC
jgi:hypothetical protein